MPPEELTNNYFNLAASSPGGPQMYGLPRGMSRGPRGFPPMMRMPPPILFSGMIRGPPPPGMRLPPPPPGVLPMRPPPGLPLTSQQQQQQRSSGPVHYPSQDPTRMGAVQSSSSDS